MTGQPDPENAQAAVPGTEITAPGTEIAPVVRPGRETHGIKPWLRYGLCKDLAVGEKTRTQLGKEHGVTQQAVSKFAKANAARIADIRDHLDEEFAGIWLADKSKRIASYTADFELSATGDRAGHFEQIRTRNDIRRHVAEELGQMPARGVTVAGIVQHVLEIENFDPGDLT